MSPSFSPSLKIFYSRVFVVFRDDLRFSNTTGILPKKRVHSLLKKILDPPLLINRWCCSGGSGVFNRYEKPMIAFTRNKFFYQNHRFTPLIKFDFLDFEKMTFLYSRKASFVFKTSLNIISGLILTEIEKKGFQDFKLPGSCC